VVGAELLHALRRSHVLVCWMRGFDAVDRVDCSQRGGQRLHIWHSWRRDTDNQIRDSVHSTHAFVWSLVVAEIGGFGMVLSGFVERQTL
jgi:hypothetical protein